VVSVLSKKSTSSFGKGRSRLLYQITALLVVVLVIIGVAVFFVINGTLNRLIEEDKKDRIDSEAQIIYADAEYIVDLQIKELLLQFPNYDVDDIIVAISEKRISDFQRYINDELQKAKDKGLLGADAVLLAQPTPQTTLPYPYVLGTNDDAYIYEEVPDYIVTGLLDGVPYIYKEDGIPELGLEGAYLITLNPLNTPFSSTTLGFVGLIPFQEKIDQINDFYSSERNRATLILALVIGGGIILIFLITFFILRRMIRTQITEPIDELTGVAGEVMEGNLDVDIEVREGEDFETLKRAFKEMIGSIRSMLERSLGE
jgi:nitrogen fixation/metabolism regulation signal transduction histidine kinase